MKASIHHSVSVGYVSCVSCVCVCVVCCGLLSWVMCTGVQVPHEAEAIEFLRTGPRDIVSHLI